MSVRCAPVRRPLPAPAALAIGVLSAALAAGLLLVGGERAQAEATITVDTLSGKAVDKKCALEEAIEAANTDEAVDACPAGSGDDTINIAVAGVIKAPSDGFRIKSNVRIQGNADGTTVDGGDVAGGLVAEEDGVFRLFLSDGSNEVVTAASLADLTISGAAGPGVNVLDRAGSTLTTSYSVSLENLRVRETLFGIHFGRVPKSGRPGDVRVRDSVLEQNNGGVLMSVCDKTPVDVKLELVNSVVRENGGVYPFGGILQGCGRLRVVNSTISENAGRLGGGVYVVQYSSGFGNRLTYRDDGTGRAATTRTEIVNSTIFGNSSLSAAGGVHVERSSDSRPVLSISHSTIVGNTTAGRSVGGGVHTRGAVTASVVNSVIAYNEGSDGSARSQCGWGAVASENVGNASSDSSCGFASENVNMGSVDLRDNGGAASIGPNRGMGNVLTVAIDVSSPLLEAGDAGACQAKDARGVTRPQGPRCDIGAYEAEVVEIGDYVWEDSDGDAVQDVGESPLEGVSLELVDDDGDVVRTDTTDSDGAYGFVVTAGEWTVRVSDAAGVLAGHRATTPASLALDVSGKTTSLLNLDFGYQPTAGAGEPVINVNTLKGATRDGRCSLAEALRAAETDETVDGCVAGSGDDTVNISVPGVMRAPSFGFEVASNVTVQGNVGGSTVSGGRGFDVIVTRSEAPDVAAATDVTLADLTITGARTGVAVVDRASATLEAAYAVTLENLHVRGASGSGVSFDKAFDSARTGAVLVKDSVIEGNSRSGIRLTACDPSRDGVVLTVSNSLIRSNQLGGVVNTCGRLRLVDSAVYRNWNLVGGGVYVLSGMWQDRLNQSGLTASTDTEIINTTIANNRSAVAGGVFAAQMAPFRPILSITNSTISGNTSDGSGGIYTFGSVSSSVTNSVIAHNGDTQCGLESSLAASEGNAASDRSCGTTAEGFTVYRGSSSLGPLHLGDNGGATPVGPNGKMGNMLTMAIGAGSGLLDAGGAAACQDEDARGTPRPQGSGCDIGAYEALVIGGRVWEDENGNRVEDGSEGGIDDVTVELRDNRGNLRGTAATDGDGGYSFVVSPGDWTIRVTDTGNILADHQATTAVAVIKTVRVDSNDLLGADFGYRPIIRIGGYVWLDADGNRERGQGEKRLGAVTLKLEDDKGKVRGQTTTDADGAYSFDVTSGVWTVRVTDTRSVLTGYQATTAESVTAEVSADGSANLDFDFGYAPEVTIGDYVWEDTNDNMAQDDDEQPIADVTLELEDDQGAVRGDTTTDADGAYSFTVTPGDWTIRVTDTRSVLTDYQATTAESITAEVSVDGESNLDFDFGFVPLVTIGDYVWEDTDADGIQDADEDPIAGVTLVAVGLGGATLRYATTDANGFYSMAVKPGEWTVSVTDAEKVLMSHQPTTPNLLRADVSRNRETNLDFDFGFRRVD